MTKHPVCKQHGHTICPECDYITDAARRISDTLNLHLIGQGYWAIKNKWMAFSLSEGTSDGVLYDSKAAAASHMLDERFYLYISFKGLAQGAKPVDCQILLSLYRDAYDANMRMHEPEAPQLLLSSKAYDSILNGIRNRPIYRG